MLIAGAKGNAVERVAGDSLEDCNALDSSHVKDFCVANMAVALGDGSAKIKRKGSERHCCSWSCFPEKRLGGVVLPCN
jgi:hypothetical protein